MREIRNAHQIFVGKPEGKDQSEGGDGKRRMTLKLMFVK
jgi:hypothetical protein